MSNYKLAAAAIAVAILCGILGWAMPERTPLWANIQWTLCFVLAPLLAWRDLASWTAASATQRMFVVGLALYALGQLVYLLQVVLGANPTPAPSDLLFLSLAPTVGLGLLFSVRTLANTSRAERAAIVADALCVLLAVVTTVLVIYLPRVSEMSVFEVVVLTAYPAGFFAMAATGLIIVLAIGANLGRHSPLLFLCGLLISAICWVVYNEFAFGQGDLHHPLTAVGFSIGTLLMGLGVGSWQLQPSGSAAWRRGSFVSLRLLPLFLVAGAAIVLGLPNKGEIPLVNTITQIGALGVIAVAVLRQGLLLWDRDRLLLAEANLSLVEEERTTLAKRLREAERLEAIGRLAGGVAHDFNNLLTPLLGHTELALNELPSDHPLRQHLLVINKAGERGAELVRQLLGFARRQFADPKPTDLNELLAEVDQLLQRTLGEHIDLALFPAPRAVVTMVDPGQMVQVILNLVANARDAMPKGGKLTIEVQGVELDQAYCQQNSDVQPGPYCRLAIHDTGSGIAAQDLQHIFEPFFTTKGTNSGTGLGLASCHGIVKQHGGHIAIYSELQRGTTVNVYLPWVEVATAVASEQSRQGLARPSKNNRQQWILVCEDDNDIRQLIQRVLGKAGYPLLVSSDGEEALAMARAHDEPIALLLTDVVMPRLGGAELAQRLTQTQADLRVLFISGYTENVVVKQGLLKPGINLLQKPFTLDNLLARVAAELERP